MTVLSLREASRLGLERRRPAVDVDGPPPPQGQPFSDLTFWTDSTGWVD